MGTIQTKNLSQILSTPTNIPVGKEISVQRGELYSTLKLTAGYVLSSLNFFSYQVGQVIPTTAATTATRAHTNVETPNRVPGLKVFVIEAVSLEILFAPASINDATVSYIKELASYLYNDARFVLTVIDVPVLEGRIEQLTQRNRLAGFCGAATTAGTTTILNEYAANVGDLYQVVPTIKLTPEMNFSFKLEYAGTGYTTTLDANIVAFFHGHFTRPTQ
jgi:hypothetical protein